MPSCPCKPPTVQRHFSVPVYPIPLNASSSETHPCVSIDLFKSVNFASLPFSGVIVRTCTMLSSPFLPSQQPNCLFIGIHLGLISAPVNLGKYPPIRSGDPHINEVDVTS